MSPRNFQRTNACSHRSGESGKSSSELSSVLATSCQCKDVRMPASHWFIDRDN
jgi:hypothetical protein